MLRACALFTVLVCQFIGDGLAASGCQTGWLSHADRCYFIGDKESLSWDDSQAKCQLLHANLASIESANEESFLRTSLVHLHGYGGPDYWIGGSDHAVRGEFVWIGTHRPVVFEYWHPAEPNHVDGNIQCISMGGHITYKYQWNDSDCSTRFHFICEAQHGHWIQIGK